MTVPDIMSLEYRAILRARIALDIRMRALGWMRGKYCIQGPHGERLPPDTSDERLMAILAFQSAAVQIKDTHKAA